MIPDELRAAAQRLRGGTSDLIAPVLAPLVAAWLDEEAACQHTFAVARGELPKVLDAVAGRSLGASLNAHFDTGPHALIVARAINREVPSEH